MSDEHINRVKEVITVRGIAANLQAMVAPTFKNLAEMVSKFGWQLIRKPTNNESDESKRNG